jgi:hypothetical protein
MLFSIKLTRKMWTVMLVSRWQWWEITVWSTARSSLQGWRLERSKCAFGFRHTNPLFGLALCIGGSAREKETETV